MNTLNRWAVLATLMAGLAGCASTRAPVLLTLPPAVSGMPVQKAPAAGVRVLSMTRLDVPEYLVARRVRYRADDSTLAEWPDTYWAERIEIGVSREFTAALRERLRDWRLCETNCAEQSPAFTLQVRMNRMDYVRSERRLRANVHLALWTTERSPRLARSEEHVYDIPGDSDTAQSQARALTELLRAVAADVAQAVAAAS